jgi:hypothetical protein
MERTLRELCQQVGLETDKEDEEEPVEDRKHYLVSLLEIADYSFSEAEKIRSMKAVEVYKYLIASDKIRRDKEKEKELGDLNKMIDEKQRGYDV